MVNWRKVGKRTLAAATAGLIGLALAKRFGHDMLQEDVPYSHDVDDVPTLLRPAVEFSDGTTAGPYELGDGGPPNVFGYGKYKLRRKFKRAKRRSRFSRARTFGKKLAAASVLSAALGAGGQFGRYHMKKYLRGF